MRTPSKTAHTKYMPIPQDIVAEIKAKSGSEGAETKVEETKVEDTKVEDTKQTDTGKESDGKADKDVKKPSKVQSIAQVADDIATDEDDEDDSDDDHGDDKSKKRGSVFKELIETRRDLKELKREDKSRADREVKMMQIITDLSDRLEDMSRNGVKVTQDEKDELEQLIEEQGLDAEGTRKFVKILEKKFGRPLTTEKKEEKKEESSKKDEDDDSKRSEARRSVAMEKAIEAQYESIVEAFPQLKDSTNLKAVKNFILSDEENHSRSIEEIIREMYPKALGENQSLDGYNPNAIVEDEKIDFQDEKVISKLKNDPVLRKKHADDLLKRVQGQYFRRSE